MSRIIHSVLLESYHYGSSSMGLLGGSSSLSSSNPIKTGKGNSCASAAAIKTPPSSTDFPCIGWTRGRNRLAWGGLGDQRRWGSSTKTYAISGKELPPLTWLWPPPPSSPMSSTKANLTFHESQPVRWHTTPATTDHVYYRTPVPRISDYAHLWTVHLSLVHVFCWARPT